MKKILDIVPYAYLPFFSGGQKSIALFLDHLGHEAELTVAGTVTNDASHAKSYTLLPLLKTSFKRYLDPSLPGTFTHIVKEKGIDAVIWEHPYLGWVARRVQKRTGVKTIFHTHNIEFARFRSNGKWWWPILEKYEGNCFRHADMVFFISDEDRHFAVDHWKLDAGKCHTVPFGIEISKYPDDKAACREKLRQLHGFAPDEKILFFNGLLDYKPNLDALKAIIDQVNPLLMADAGFKYKIMICGKRLPEEMNELKAYADKNVVYAGFVEDINLYFKGADLFLNPVQSGGGIKTKMVESIAFGTTVLATETGALGIDRTVCGDKLIVVKDDEWQAFAEQIKKPSAETQTPAAYYETYYWGSIVKKVVKLISG